MRRMPELEGCLKESFGWLLGWAKRTRCLLAWFSEQLIVSDLTLWCLDLLALQLETLPGESDGCLPGEWLAKLAVLQF